MENAAEALKMAAWVLIFVVALSIIINAFGLARQTSDILLSYRDREYYATEDQYVAENEKTERIVGYESIIPTIYRAYKENYKIIFQNSNGEPMNFYTNKYDVDINYIDLNKESVGDDKNKEEFIKCVLSGKDDASRFLGYEFDKFNLKGLYGQIEGKKFYEYLGVYYQEEIGEDESNTPNANKTKKRVITYKQV